MRLKLHGADLTPGVLLRGLFYWSRIVIREFRSRRILAAVGAVVLLACCVVPVSFGEKKKGPAHETASYTPMPLDSGFGALNTTPPAMPADEIIRRFEAKETEFRKALAGYTYRRSVRVQTIDDDDTIEDGKVDDGKVDGEYYQIDDVVFDSNGRRREKVVYAPANSLTRIAMSPADFSDIQDRLPFVLTTQDAGQYKVEYLGRQKVDEVECYVFTVAPRQMEKGKRYFQGKIWVDTEALQIVVTSGKNVPDDLRAGHEDLSTPFTTYREQVDGKNWFPTYSKSDGVLHFPAGKGYMVQNVHIRQTVKFTDYKQYGSTAKIIESGQVVEKPDVDTPDSTKPPQPGQPH